MKKKQSGTSSTRTTESQGKVWCSVGLKLGLPNYSSADFQCSAEIPLEPGESVTKGLDRVRKMVMDSWVENNGTAFDEIQSVANQRSTRGRG